MVKQVNLKVWPDTLPKLRLVYALTGESMVSIVDRLITQELERIQHENRQNIQIQAVPAKKE